MTLRTSLALLALVLLAACHHETPLPTEEKAFQGAWTDTAYPNLRWIFTGSELMTMNRPGVQPGRSVYTYTADTSTTPNGLNLVSSDIKINAAYRLDGDDLTIWYAPTPDAPRPTGDPGPDAVVFKLRKFNP